MLSELQPASQSGALYTRHFNMLHSILEKIATFFGHKDLSDCLHIADEGLHARALNLLSHGRYSRYEPKEMVEDNKVLFKDILAGFLQRHVFTLPDLEPAGRRSRNGPGSYACPAVDPIQP